MANVTLDPSGTVVTAIFAMPQTFSTVIPDDDPRIAAFQAAQAPPQNYSFLQFMALFASAEEAAIVASADPQIKLFALMAAGAGALQLNNPEVAAGVNYLVGAGILTSARASAVLAGAAPT